MRRTALALLLCACTRATSDRPERPDAAPTEPPPATDALVEAPDEPDPLPPGRDHLSFVACESDSDCGWDDPCKPTRCVEASAPATCSASSPAPGTCSCVDKACTLRPDDTPPASAACEVHGCMVDRAAGRCVADTGGVPEATRSAPRVEVGPSCDCVVPGEPCTFTWFEAVACKRDSDCWVDHSPRPHPVARKHALRFRAFKPCDDGPIAPRCSPSGTCTFGLAFKC